MNNRLIGGLISPRNAHIISGHFRSSPGFRKRFEGVADQFVRDDGLFIGLARVQAGLR